MKSDHGKNSNFYLNVETHEWKKDDYHLMARELIFKDEAVEEKYDAGRARLNRRVEIRLLDPGACKRDTDFLKRYLKRGRFDKEPSHQAATSRMPTSQHRP